MLSLSFEIFNGKIPTESHKIFVVTNNFAAIPDDTLNINRDDFLTVHV